MKISISDLKNERQWRSSTGYDQKRFCKLLALFDQAYLKLFGKTLPQRHADGPSKSSIASTQDLLFFTLFSLKSGLTYDLLGLVTGMDGATAKRNQDLDITVLKSMLSEQNIAPIRFFSSVDEFEKYFHQYDTLIIDATEQPIQRPLNEYDQKVNYSGKKKDIP